MNDINDKFYNHELCTVLYRSCSANVHKMQNKCTHQIHRQQQSRIVNKYDNRHSTKWYCPTNTELLGLWRHFQCDAGLKAVSVTSKSSLALETFQTEDLWQECKGNGENSPF